ncbi:hypothetical protein Ciccas_000587 [Cichlidogyrus casuarinus]|uniref:Malonyl-CoA:ACP transacylase (MAT) domain-containing protein n=1 Tax=Cichlidogyrus casuarinus TaxID=1844966 RepID=A0ABD2QMI0_9PLAT
MAKNLLEYPGVKDLYERASEILKTDILRVCLEGPADKLTKTIFTQPALVVTSLAAVLKLKSQNTKMVENCVATAGFSVGEMAALVFAGALTFEQGVQMTKIRAESMQKCCDKYRGSMLSVSLGHESELRSAINAAKLYCVEKCNISKPVLKIACHLHAECKVVAGHAQAVKYLEDNASAFGIKKTSPVPVSGAFHTPLMHQASISLKEKLTGIAESIKSPQIPVVSNVSAEPYRNRESIPQFLSDQVVKTVKWEQTMHALFSRPNGEPFPKVYEVGPGKQLGSILRIVSRPAFKNYNHISP